MGVTVQQRYWATPILKSPIISLIRRYTMSRSTATALAVAQGELEAYERLVAKFPGDKFWIKLRNKWATVVKEIEHFVDEQKAQK